MGMFSDLNKLDNRQQEEQIKRKSTVSLSSRVDKDVLENRNAPSVRPSGNPSVRTPVRRTLTRQPYELFEDQVQTLRKWALDEEIQTGKRGSASAMVREAIDSYIATKKDQT